jgi:hypothetical protein
LQRCRESLPEGHLETLQAMDQLALILEAQGKWMELEPLAKEYLQGRLLHTPGLAKKSHAQSLLGASLVGLQQVEAAEPLVLEAYENLKKSESRGYELTQDVTRAAQRLARLYEVKGEVSEAGRWREVAQQAASTWPPPEATTMPLPEDTFGPVTTTPSPNPLTYDLRLVSDLFGEVLSLSDSGDIVTRRKTTGGVETPVMYWAPRDGVSEQIVEGTKLLRPDDAAKWTITFPYAANRSGEIICQAREGEGVHQICRLNCAKARLRR